MVIVPLSITHMNTNLFDQLYLAKLIEDIFYINLQMSSAECNRVAEKILQRYCKCIPTRMV